VRHSVRRFQASPARRSDKQFENEDVKMDRSCHERRAMKL
jgi:hypothetical protein